jgi:chromosome segregation ATPase
MQRLWATLAISCIPLCAQALPDLEQAATKAQQQWYALSSTLDTRLQRMLPCDNAAVLAIEETHRASTSRLTALIAYTQGVIAQSAQDVAMARRIQKSETDYATTLAGERTDTEQERAGIASQMTNLSESLRRRVTLTVANDELRALEASVRDRATLVAANVTASEAALPRFDALIQALERRETALRKQITSLEDERVKWNGYYTARLARAQVECTETGR